MMMFETSKHVPKTEKCCRVFKVKYYSIFFKVVCDDNMLFTDVLAGWPGSVHDSRVLRNSVL